MGVLLPRVQCKCCFFFSSAANITLYICCMYQCSFCIPLLASHNYTVLRPEKNPKNVIIKSKAGLFKISPFANYSTREMRLTRSVAFPSG